MPREIPKATEKELRKAAKNYASAMCVMHSSHQIVAVTLARLVEVMDRADDAPFAGGTLAQRADEAMGELGRAYERVAALFD